MVLISDEDELIQEVLQEAWTKLLKLRKQGKLKNFDINVPSQILSWVEDIYKTQLATYERVNKEHFHNKRFAIAITFRVAINNILGIQYFMEQMLDEPRMQAMDRMLDDIYQQIRHQNKVDKELV